MSTTIHHSPPRFIIALSRSGFIRSEEDTARKGIGKIKISPIPSVMR
jgi:hypothetical protein